MKLRRLNADILVPDGTAPAEALSRTTHLGIGAHADDLEIMAMHGILTCFGRRDKWFTGVTCTDGRGSPRTGIYADYTDDEMVQLRQEEQRQAARIGRYSAMLQLMVPSAEAKDTTRHDLCDELVKILRATKPDVLYTHNPADKHATHIAVLTAVLAALRRLPADERPGSVYGCEVWRDLDWLPDNRKVVLDVGGRDNLAAALLAVFDSQIAGGKRYDLAAIGRRVANATYLESHAADTITATTFAIDLSPIVHDDRLDLVDYVTGFVREFQDSVRAQLEAVARP